MKKLLVVCVAMLAAFGLAACGGADNNAEPVLTQLGTSEYAIMLPAGYANDEAYVEDEDQVAYYASEDEALVIYVYQWEKDGDHDLAAEAAIIAAEYDSTAEAVTVNGMDAMKYITHETHDGIAYTFINYMFDNGTDWVEVDFCMEGNEEEQPLADELINTVVRNEEAA